MIANKEEERYFNLGAAKSEYETITQPIFDTLPYPKAGGFLRFFQFPIGAGNPIKTWAETNMHMACQLPNATAFVVQSIRLKLLLDQESRADERRFYSQGQVSFQIGAKSYFQGVPGELSPQKDPEITITFDLSEPDQVRVTAGTGEEKAQGLVLAPNNLLLIPHQYFCLVCDQLPKLRTKARLAAILYGNLMRQVC